MMRSFMVSIHFFFLMFSYFGNRVLWLLMMYFFYEKNIYLENFFPQKCIEIFSVSLKPFPDIYCSILALFVFSYVSFSF